MGFLVTLLKWNQWIKIGPEVSLCVRKKGNSPQVVIKANPSLKIEKLHVEDDRRDADDRDLNEKRAK